MADPITGLLRPRIAAGSLDLASVIIDERRSRPVWFDGQFITATAFNAEQSYLLVRQADLGRAFGVGVVDGLQVTRAAGSVTALVVSPGHGVAGGGETVVLHTQLRVDVASLATQRDLAQRLRLNRLPAAPLESRSGVFVLVATPIEYTSEPVGSYPTTLDGERRLEDSVINEALLLSLVPYGLASSGTSPDQRQAIAARRIFADGAEPDIPTGSLALAMLELDGNRIIWLDESMVRRESGVLKSDVFGLGFAPEPLRAAHLRQYDAAIERLMAEAPATALQARLGFRALPPMGRMPAAAISFRTPPGATTPVLTQAFFPHPMPVDLAAVPEDEIAALIEESFLLPPIDLDAPPEVLDDTPVTIFVPVARTALTALPASIRDGSVTLAAPPPIGVRPTSPKDLLTTLISAKAPAPTPAPVADAEWQALLGGRTTLWFARRRQLARRDAPLAVSSPFRLPTAILGQADETVAPEVTATTRVGVMMDRFALADTYAEVRTRAAPTAATALDTLMQAVGTHDSGLVAQGVLAELPAARFEADAVARASDRYQKGAVGGAVARYEGLLLGGETRIVLTNAGADRRAAEKLVAEVTGKPEGAAALLRSTPVVLPPAADVATALKWATAGQKAGVSLVVRPASQTSAVTTARRAKLAATLRVPELDKAMATANEDALTKLIEQVSKTVATERVRADTLLAAVNRAIEEISQ